MKPHSRLTQSAIASAAGITQGHFSKLKHALRRPRYQTGKRLEAITGVPLPIWMEGTAEEIQTALAAALKTTDHQEAA